MTREAEVLAAKAMMLRDNPERASVYEEVFHAQRDLDRAAEQLEAAQINYNRCATKLAELETKGEETEVPSGRA